MEQGLKNDQGKLRWDLLPPRALEEVVRVYTLGAKKYADRNWEKGLIWGRVFAAMMRHAWAWWRGERHDSVDGQHHLASVAWCALALMTYEGTHPELDDRPKHAEVDDRPCAEKRVATDTRMVGGCLDGGVVLRAPTGTAFLGEEDSR